MELHTPLVRVFLFGAITTLVPLLVKGEQELSIVPRPVHTSRRPGHFSMTRKSQIVYFTANSEMRATVELFAERLRKATGFPLPVRDAGRMPDRDFIFFNYIREEELGREGYELQVTRSNIEVNANNGNGFFYGAETLLQLLPPEAYSPVPVRGVRWDIPCLSMTDKPRFPWRGMHLDVSRHFFPKEFIFTYLDMLAMHKMNVFHWHLTDDQGWRIEITKYPKLTSVGAWRADRESQPWGNRTPQQPGEKATYGGFYTEQDIRDIVKYASERNITVVPEIEMPAHATAALAAYPQFSCTGGPFTVVAGAIWPNVNTFCAGNDSTFTFLEDVLAEVCRLFPGRYIHIGGDEADKSHWKNCPRCQERIRTLGLHDEEGLQSYFVKRIEKFLSSKHRTLIGWDEILQGGLAPDATVMSWRGTAGGIAAAREGHDVIMTPTSHCYFDYYQGPGSMEPQAGGGTITLRKVYEFEPVPDSLTPGQAKHILGGQGNVWTEFIPTPSHARYMTLPRMAAMAEALWSPRELRDWRSFVPRVERQMRRYEVLGYTYARSGYEVAFTPAPDSSSGSLRIVLATELGTPDIRYTTDGTPPTAKSPRYEMPLTMEHSGTVRAAAFQESRPLCPPSAQEIVVHSAIGRNVTLKTPCDPRYPGSSPSSLTDGFLGSPVYDDGNWQGFLEQDFEGVVDLGEDLPVSQISCNFLQSLDASIFVPDSVAYLVSRDGNVYSSAKTFTHPRPAPADSPAIVPFTAKLEQTAARFIKVRARNAGRVPPGYPWAGRQAWIFIDEIVVR